jgi:nucleoside-diphosphate-sugar epimerase
LKQISILGCGWLGFPLAKSLLSKNYSINGSTTSFSKLEVMKLVGISPFLLSLDENEIQGDISNFLLNSEILIIAIPPKLRGNSKESFVSKIKILLPSIQQSTIKKVIFISSTSVYADDNTIVTENTIPNPETKNGLQLLNTEKLLQNSTFFQTTILRFGGLIGKDRHPIRFLAGRTNLENPEAPINLIHQQDCIAIIERIIEQDCWGEVFNAVAPFHPSRKRYYTEKAIEYNLAFPQFNENLTSIGKTISSDKLIRILGYEFKNLG